MRAIIRFFATLLASLGMLLGVGCNSQTDVPVAVYGPPEYFQSDSPADGE